MRSSKDLMCIFLTLLWLMRILKRRHQKYTNESFIFRIGHATQGQCQKVIGVNNIESSKSGMFSESDIDKIKGFAGQAAVAVYVLQLFSKLAIYKQHAAVLSDIEMNIFSAHQSPTDTLVLILKSALK